MGALDVTSETKVIGGVTYSVQPLPLYAAIRVMCRALRMSAGAFSNVASLRDAAKAMATLFVTSIGDLDDDSVIFIAEQLAKVSSYAPGPGKVLPLAGILDLHFQGRIVEWFEWMRFALEVTYGPLVRRLQLEADKLKAEAEAAKAAAPPAAG